MLPWTSQLYTVQEVLHKFYDIATDESDGENLELDWDGESFDQVTAGEEVGDGYCSGNKQFTDCDCSESSSETCREKGDDGHEHIAKLQRKVQPVHPGRAKSLTLG